MPTTIENGFERAIYAIDPDGRAVFRYGSCTRKEDHKVRVTFPDGWIAKREDTSENGINPWQFGGPLYELTQEHKVNDEDWTFLTVPMAKELGVQIEYLD